MILYSIDIFWFDKGQNLELKPLNWQFKIVTNILCHQRLSPLLSHQGWSYQFLFDKIFEFFEMTNDSDMFIRVQSSLIKIKLFEKNSIQTGDFWI